MQSSTRTLQNSIIPSPNMFHRLSSTLPVLLVFLSTLVAPSLQEQLCCDAVFQDADGTKTLVFLNAGLCFLVYCIAYHGNSAIRCSSPGIDCPFSFQVFADCDLVVCSFSLIRQKKIFDEFGYVNSLLRVSVAIASRTSNVRLFEILVKTKCTTICPPWRIRSFTSNKYITLISI